MSRDKDEHLEQMRRAAHLQNDAVASKAHVDNLHRERERLRQRSEQTTETLASIDSELQDLVHADDSLQTRWSPRPAGLEQRRHERRKLGRQIRDDTVDSLSQLRQQRSRPGQPHRVPGGLIRSHEGLGTGVREVFALIEQADAGALEHHPRHDRRFLTVKREYAPLIDLALGDWAQRFIVRDVAMLDGRPGRTRAAARRPREFLAPA